MKKIFFILSIFFLLSIIICKDNINSHKIKKKKKGKKKNKHIKSHKDKLETKEKEIEKEEEEENEPEEPEEEEEEYNPKLKGIYMTQRAFNEKFNRIFEERGLKNKKKITKKKLKAIFEEIYKDEFEKEDSDFDSDNDPQRLLDLIFNEIFKGYDYDDKIKIKGLKKLINPKNAQDAMFTVYVDVAGSLGYL